MQFSTRFVFNFKRINNFSVLLKKNNQKQFLLVEYKFLHIGMRYILKIIHF